MPISHTYTTESDIDVTYWRIVSIVTNVEQSAVVLVLYGYINEAAYTNNGVHANVMTQQLIFQGADYTQWADEVFASGGASKSALILAEELALNSDFFEEGEII